MPRSIVGISEIKKLRLPKPASHKGENGRLLVIAGSSKYHGSLLYAVKTAARIVDLIYVLTTSENEKLIRKLKSMTAGFITVKGLGDRVKGIVDCTLIGPGMGKSRRTYNLTRRILASNTKAVLDADALNVLDAKLRKLLSERHILTPHKMEFYRVFKLAPTAANVLKMAGKYRCTIVLKGPVDVIGHPKKGIVYNRTGNQGMTKGGTGDVLAGLIAALSCKNDAYPAAAAGVFINGRAGDDLYKKVGTFYSAEDLVEQIPKTMWYLLHPAP